MLCTVDDVALEGAFELPAELKTKIEYKIRNVSEHIRQITKKDLNSEKYAYYARMACVYGVLTWLESKRLILPSSVVSVREGNVSITYRGSFMDTNQPSSYKDSYDSYLSFLLPYPPVGAL